MRPQASWISAASERQRRGRAGRCQPGVAYHLYSRVRSNGLAPFQLPELHRTSLDELCLQARAAAACRVLACPPASRPLTPLRATVLGTLQPRHLLGCLR